MRFIRWASIAVLVLPADTAAQDTGGAVHTQRELWQDITRNFSRAAAQVPESLYSFRPAPTVRTFGQIVAHVAGSQFNMCAVALGEPARPEDAVEQAKTTKPDIVAALQASTEFCERAYAQTDATSRTEMELFGRRMSRLATSSPTCASTGWCRPPVNRRSPPPRHRSQRKSAAKSTSLRSVRLAFTM
jgi:hypothetical protein